MTVTRMPFEDFPVWATIVSNAYPAFGMHSDEARNRFIERARAHAEEDSTVVTFGCYRDGALLGGMRVFDFEMNMLGVTVPAGGVGLVAVDVAHKKEKVARDLIQFFVRHARERGMRLTLLYPFRPDFYRDMGYGYGTKMSQYRFRPAALAHGGDKRRVTVAGPDDQQQIVSCYNRFAAKRHGMIQKARYELNGMFNNPASRIVAYRDGDTIRGYLCYTFKQRNPENFVLNDLVVTELIYESPDVLAGLLAFIRSQADQVDRVVLTTQDDSFHHLLRDPRNGSEPMIPSVYHESDVEGVGLMYRVSDVAGFFGSLSGHDFGGQTCTVNFTIRDTFLPENDGQVLVRFEQGYPHVLQGGTADVEARLDVAAFSSLIMGCVRFERLYAYGMAEVSNPDHVDTLDRLFATREKPMCVTAF